MPFIKIEEVPKRTSFAEYFLSWVGIEMYQKIFQHILIIWFYLFFKKMILFIYLRESECTHKQREEQKERDKQIPH